VRLTSHQSGGVGRRWGGVATVRLQGFAFSLDLGARIEGDLAVLLALFDRVVVERLQVSVNVGAVVRHFPLRADGLD
jgi:hypothetical protein